MRVNDDDLAGRLEDEIDQLSKELRTRHNGFQVNPPSPNWRLAEPQSSAERWALFCTWKRYGCVFFALQALRSGDEETARKILEHWQLEVLQAMRVECDEDLRNRGAAVLIDEVAKRISLGCDPELRGEVARENVPTNQAIRQLLSGPAYLAFLRYEPGTGGLFRITRDAANEIRRQRLKPLPQDALEGARAKSTADVECDRNDHAAELHARAERCGLTDKESLAVKMLGCGKTLGEAALAMGTSREGVRSALRRAQKKIEKKIGILDQKPPSRPRKG